MAKISALTETTSPALTAEIPISVGTGASDTKKVKIQNLGYKEIFYATSTPTATTSPALWINSSTGEIKVWNGSTWTSKNYLSNADTIPLASLSNQSEARLLGRAAGAGTGAVTALTPAEARTALNVADGANAYVHPNHSGDVTSSGDGATTIANDAVTTAKIIDEAVTNAKLADAAANTLKGRIAATTGPVSDLALAANRIPGRSSTGDIAAKPCSDVSFNLIAQTTTAGWQETLQVTSCEHLLGQLPLANFNSTADQAITLESGTKIITKIIVTNSALSTAAGGFYDGSGKSGNAWVANTQTYTTSAVNDIEELTLTSYATGHTVTDTTIYFSLTTAEGSAASGDIYIFGYNLG